MFFTSNPNFIGKDKDKAENVGRSMKYYIIAEEFPNILNRFKIIDDY